MDNNKRTIINDLAKALSGVFQKYSYHARREGWNAITSASGKKDIDKLINNPTRSLSNFRTLTFKEWLKERHAS